jgi:hypothetical protein
MMSSCCLSVCLTELCFPLFQLLNQLAPSINIIMNSMQLQLIPVLKLLICLDSQRHLVGLYENLRDESHNLEP